MNKNLNRIEKRLRTLFEKSLLRMFPRHHSQSSLIDDLIQVMRNNLREDSTGKTLAPNIFIIHVPPEDLLDWQSHQDILDELANSLYEVGRMDGLVFTQPPETKLQVSTDIKVNEYLISTEIPFTDAILPDTAAMDTTGDRDESGRTFPENAYLIVGGTKNFPLEKAIINIGRHSENELVLEDPHVSRHHAQLRVMGSHYAVFDVGSTAGITLNGKQINQATLHAGDVLRIGSTTLIYIQDPTSTNPTSAMAIDQDGQLSAGGVL